MFPQTVTCRAAARGKILRVAQALAEAVRLTLGPKSKTVSVASVLLRTAATMTGVPEPREHPPASMEPELE